MYEECTPGAHVRFAFDGVNSVRKPGLSDHLFRIFGDLLKKIQQVLFNFKDDLYWIIRLWDEVGCDDSVEILMFKNKRYCNEVH